MHWATSGEPWDPQNWTNEPHFIWTPKIGPYVWITVPDNDDEDDVEDDYVDKEAMTRNTRTTTRMVMIMMSMMTKVVCVIVRHSRSLTASLVRRTTVLWWSQLPGYSSTLSVSSSTPQSFFSLYSVALTLDLKWYYWPWRLCLWPWTEFFDLGRPLMFVSGIVIHRDYSQSV